jgi:uncharacterized protein YjbI with pentapeptide repeats
MDETMLNTLKQLMHGLRAFYRTLERGLQENHYTGTGKMMLRNYQTLQQKLAELLPDDFYVRDMLRLDIDEQADERAQLTQVQFAASQMLIYLENLLREEQAAPPAVDAQGIPLPPEPPLPPDWRGFGREISEQIMNLTRNTLRRALSNVDVQYDIDLDLPGGKRFRAVHVGAGANLAGKDLSGVDLREQDLENANLSGANLTGANLDECNMEGINLSGANLTAANLSEVNMERANLRGVSGEGANFRAVNADGAAFDGALLTGANFREANLEGATLIGCTLEGADFTNANLEDARLENVKLMGANLTEANLTNALLNGADLTGAILQDALLEDADLRGAILTGAVLHNAVLENAIMPDGQRYRFGMDLTPYISGTNEKPKRGGSMSNGWLTPLHPMCYAVQ